VEVPRPFFSTHRFRLNVLQRRSGETSKVLLFQTWEFFSRFAGVRWGTYTNRDLFRYRFLRRDAPACNCRHVIRRDEYRPWWMFPKAKWC